jgi:hypothetical protein
LGAQMDLFAETRGTEDGGGEEINLGYFLLRMTDRSPAFPLLQTSLVWSTKTKIHYLASHQLCETSRNYAQGMRVA